MTCVVAACKALYHYENPYLNWTTITCIMWHVHAKTDFNESMMSQMMIGASDCLGMVDVSA